MEDSMMKKLLDKKGKGSKLSDSEKEAKMSVLEDLRKMMEDHMGESLGGLKKVTVASPDKEGLESGLDKAREMIGQIKEGDHSPEDAEMEALEEESHEDLDHDNEEGESSEHKAKVFGHDRKVRVKWLDHT